MYEGRYVQPYINMITSLATEKEKNSKRFTDTRLDRLLAARAALLLLLARYGIIPFYRQSIFVRGRYLCVEPENALVYPVRRVIFM